MKINTGIDRPGIPTEKKPHLGDILLKKYKDRITEGFEDLKRFELIDRLEKAWIYGAFQKRAHETHTSTSHDFRN